MLHSRIGHNSSWTESQPGSPTIGHAVPTIPQARRDSILCGAIPPQLIRTWILQNQSLLLCRVSSPSKARFCRLTLSELECSLAERGGNSDH